MKVLFKCCLIGKTPERDSSIELYRGNERISKVKENARILGRQGCPEVNKKDTLLLSNLANESTSSPINFPPCKAKQSQKSAISAIEEAKVSAKQPTPGDPELIADAPEKKPEIVASSLVLEVIEANKIEKGKQYTIDIKSLVKDSEIGEEGTRYFGGLSTEETSCQKRLDFIFPIEENFSPMQFCIQFRAVQNSYYLKNLSSPSTFINLGKPFVLWPSTIICLGHPNIQAQITVHDPEKPEAASELSFSILGEKNQIRSFRFTQRDSPIWIGRTELCKVRFKSESLSRIQAKIEFRNKVWSLMDGDGLKHSTNGTWICPDHSFPLSNCTIFRSGGVIFKCLVKSREITSPSTM